MMKPWTIWTAGVALAAAPVPAEAAPFAGWNVQTHAALVASGGQVAEIATPGAAPHPLASEIGFDLAGWAPRKGDVLVAGKAGQLYALSAGQPTLLTDGRSRNRPGAWSHDGHWLAYASNRRTGADDDIYVVDPRDPKSDRLTARLTGTGWALLDFTADGTSAVVAHRLSPARAALFFMDVASGAMQPIGRPGAYADARFSYDGVLWAIVAGRLGMIDVATGVFTPVAPDSGVTRLEVSLDGKLVAYAASGTLKLLDTRSGQARAVAGVPAGAIDDLHFAPWGALGFSVAGGDVYALDPATLTVTRWTAPR